MRRAPARRSGRQFRKRAEKTHAINQQINRRGGTRL